MPFLDPENVRIIAFEMDIEQKVDFVIAFAIRIIDILNMPKKAAACNICADFLTDFPS